MRKSGKFEGSNLRILAIAFANNRIDRKTYVRLRTQQLSALEFNRPLPPLPRELLDINVPSVKIDAPHINKSGDNPLIKWLVITLITLGVVAATYVAYVRFQDSSEVNQAIPLTLDEQARKLLATPVWSEQDLTAFTSLWSAYSDEAKQQAKQTEWFHALENEIIKRINQTKLQRGSADDLREYQNKLNTLRVFYSEVVAE